MALMVRLHGLLPRWHCHCCCCWSCWHSTGRLHHPSTVKLPGWLPGITGYHCKLQTPVIGTDGETTSTYVSHIRGYDEKMNDKNIKLYCLIQGSLDFALLLLSFVDMDTHFKNTHTFCAFWQRLLSNINERSHSLRWYRHVNTNYIKIKRKVYW